jgi:hypothetical protein
MELHETKKLLHSKGNNHQTQETAYRMRENFSQLYMSQGINYQNIQVAWNLTLQRINNPLNKWGKQIEQKILKRSTNGQ